MTILIYTSLTLNLLNNEQWLLGANYKLSFGASSFSDFLVNCTQVKKQQIGSDYGIKY